MPPITEGGKTVLLRQLEESEAAQVCAWRNNPEVGRFFHRKHIEPDEYVKWMREVAADANQGLYAITRKSDSTLLGTLAYKIHVEKNNEKSATLGIMIGQAAERGKGYGEQAMELLTNDLAARYGVKKAVVEVLPENKAAAAFYKKLGYTTELLVMSKML